MSCYKRPYMGLVVFSRARQGLKSTDCSAVTIPQDEQIRSSITLVLNQKQSSQIGHHKRTEVLSLITYYKLLSDAACVNEY